MLCEVLLKEGASKIEFLASEMPIKESVRRSFQNTRLSFPCLNYSNLVTHIELFLYQGSFH